MQKEGDAGDAVSVNFLGLHVIFCLFLRIVCRHFLSSFFKLKVGSVQFFKLKKLILFVTSAVVSRVKFCLTYGSWIICAVDFRVILSFAEHFQFKTSQFL